LLSADWSAVPEPVPYANLSNPQTLNLYAMVSDNPETFADLDGHCHPPDGGCPQAKREQVGNTPTTSPTPPPPPPPPVSQASAGVMVLPILGRALAGGEGGAEGGGAIGTVEPGGGNLVGAIIGAVAGAATAALAPTLYSKAKDEAGKAWQKFETAKEHLGSPNKLGGPDKDPRRGWKGTVRRAADEMDKHADRMTGHQTAARAIHLAADFVRGLIPED
jgi:hypothetical protein